LSLIETNFPAKGPLPVGDRGQKKPPDGKAHDKAIPLTIPYCVWVDIIATICGQRTAALPTKRWIGIQWYFAGVD